jgi:hypothetical protein
VFYRNEDYRPLIKVVVNYETLNRTFQMVIRFDLIIEFTDLECPFFGFSLKLMFSVLCFVVVDLVANVVSVYELSIRECPFCFMNGDKIQHKREN